MIAIKQVRTQQELEAVIDIQLSVFTEEHRIAPTRPPGVLLCEAWLCQID